MEKNNNQARSRKRTFACLYAFRLSFQSDEKQNEFYLQTEHFYVNKKLYKLFLVETHLFNKFILFVKYFVFSLMYVVCSTTVSIVT